VGKNRPKAKRDIDAEVSKSPVWENISRRETVRGLGGKVALITIGGEIIRIGRMKKITKRRRGSRLGGSAIVRPKRLKKVWVDCAKDEIIYVQKRTRNKNSIRDFLRSITEKRATWQNKEPGRGPEALCGIILGGAVKRENGEGDEESRGEGQCRKTVGGERAWSKRQKQSRKSIQRLACWGPGVKQLKKTRS